MIAMEPSHIGTLMFGLKLIPFLCDIGEGLRCFVITPPCSNGYLWENPVLRIDWEDQGPLSIAVLPGLNRPLQLEPAQLGDWAADMGSSSQGTRRERIK